MRIPHSLEAGKPARLQLKGLLKSYLVGGQVSPHIDVVLQDVMHHAVYVIEQGKQLFPAESNH